MRTIYLIIFIVFFSCKKEEVQIIKEKYSIKDLKSIEDSIKNISSDDKIATWKSFLNNQKSDSTKAYIHYFIAKNFVEKSIDSSKYHINLAYDLVEKQEEQLGIKIWIYVGMGNIATLEKKPYQAAYYYNKSAALIIANKNLKIKPLDKVISLVNAAQQNQQLYQYAKATKQNEYAIELLKQIPENLKYKNRAYSQLFICYRHEKRSRESLKKIIEEIEIIVTKTRDQNEIKFLNEHKMNYYILENNIELAIEYAEKCKDYAEKKYNEESEIFDTNNSNLYIALCNLINLYSLKKNFQIAQKYIEKNNEIEKKFNSQITDDVKATKLIALANYYREKGDYKKSNQELEQLTTVRENILSKASIESIEEMSTIYQLKSKDRSIRALGININAQQEKIKEKQFLLIITILSALLASTLLTFLYYSQKQKKVNEEKEKTILQQRLLRTQMEPHFIFNTLSSLQSFIRFDEKEKSLKYLNQFSRLLRSSLELSRQNLVPLDEELEALENYLSLQQMRNNHTFNYQINSSEILDDSFVMIPPMLIQPFVENAIIHGLDSKDNNGLIKIDIQQKENLLIVKIKDNGTGFSKRETSINKQYKSLSGTIARERLDLLSRKYKKPFNLNTYSERNKGTTIELTLPIL